MKYFSINNSLDKKVLGHYPQVKEIKHNCNIWDEPKFIEHLNFIKIEFKPITSSAILFPTSKLTDLISINSKGFTRKLLLSSRLKRIIENNRNSGIEFYNSDLFCKNKLINDYWIINVHEIDMCNVDVENSNFVLRKKKEGGGTYLSDIEFKFLEEFTCKIIKEELEGKLYLNKIKIKEDVTADFFTLLNVEGGVKYVVSEKLKKEIEDYGCTGIEFQPLEFSSSEWLQGGEREKIYGRSG